LFELEGQIKLWESEKLLVAGLAIVSLNKALLLSIEAGTSNIAILLLFHTVHVV
jgi:hypothetical protein